MKKYFTFNFSNHINSNHLIYTLLFIIFISICGVSASGADTTPPKLVSTNPVNGEQNVPINQRMVSFTFNEEMLSGFGVTTWVNDSADPNIKSHDWSTDTEWSSDHRTATLIYNKNLPIETKIILILNPSTHMPCFKDLSGNPLPSDISVSFHTSNSIDSTLMSALNPTPTPSPSPSLTPTAEEIKEHYIDDFPQTMETSQVLDKGGEEDSPWSEPIINCNDCHNIVHNILYETWKEESGWYYITPFYPSFSPPGILGYFFSTVKIYKVPDECGINTIKSYV